MFTYEFYHNIIKSLNVSGYTFSSFNSSNTQIQTVYLRHDVDFDIWGCMELGNIEQINGVKSAFFFQPNAELYNIFSKECIEIIEKLNSMGHEIGLHIDAAPFNNIIQLQKHIKDAYHYYSNYMPLSKIISFHRPAPFILNSNIKIDGFINAYDNKFYKDIVYVSDSNQREFWNQKNWQNALLGEKSMQLLTHPIWWGYCSQSVNDVKNNYIKKYADYCNRGLARSSKALNTVINGVTGGENNK